MSELTTHKGVDALNCLLLLLLQCWIVPVQHFCKCEHCESPLFLRTFVAYYRMFPCENISTVWAIVYFEKKSAVFQLGGHRLSFLWDLILCHFTREKLYTENIWKLKSKKKKIIEKGVYNRQRVSQRFPQGLFVGSTITSSILVHSELINCCWSWSANAFSFVKSVVFVLPSFLLHLVFFYFRLHQHTFKLNFRKQTLLSAKTKKKLRTAHNISSLCVLLLVRRQERLNVFASNTRVYIVHSCWSFGFHVDRSMCMMSAYVSSFLRRLCYSPLLLLPYLFARFLHKLPVHTRFAG